MIKIQFLCSNLKIRINKNSNKIEAFKKHFLIEFNKIKTKVIWNQ